MSPALAAAGCIFAGFTRYSPFFSGLLVREILRAIFYSVRLTLQNGLRSYDHPRRVDERMIAESLLVELLRALECSERASGKPEITNR